MDREALAEARQKAQEAQSAARLTTDPQIKAHWERLAASMLARVRELEGSAGSAVTPVIPPLADGDNPRP